MAEHPIFFVGNRNPSIAETITINGTPQDLSASTVRFKARQVGSATLLVDQAAVFVTDGTNGQVRYDWSAADIGTGGILAAARQALVWWEVTSGTKKQDMAEALIEVRAHSNSQVYVELEQFKSTAELTGETYGDQDIRAALVAATRAVNETTGRRFWLDTDNTQVRVYTPQHADQLAIHDLVDLDSVTVDTTGDGTYEQTWTENTDFVLEPLNADLDGWPWTRLVLHPSSSVYLPHYPRSVKVTAQFGWPAVPGEIVTATTIIASGLFKRAREAPHGVVAFGTELGGTAIRIARSDPQVSGLLAPYVREKP